MQFDLLIKGGDVLDPGAGYRNKMDIAVKRDRIAAVDHSISADSAYRVIDATGLTLTPGLIDMHAHIYEGVSYFGINADAVGSQSGVTTMVDAGSSGAITFQGLNDYIIQRSRVQLFAFINISCTGLVAQNYELSLNEYCSIDLLERVVKRFPERIVGIKIRSGTSGGGVDLIPYQRARRAADDLGLPIMMHVSTAPPDLDTALSYLGRGDILTHCYTGQNQRLIDDQGKILPEAKEAIDRGVYLDLGHGAGSLSFKSAEALTSQGYWPDFVSTDMHPLSVVGSNLVLADPERGLVFLPNETDEDASSWIVHFKDKDKGKLAFSLLTCMDKMLAIGMPFEEIIKATTCRPADFLGLKGEIGTLRPGARADITGLVIEDRDIELRDIHGEVRHGSQSVCHRMTILGGHPFEPVPIPPLPAWVEMSEL